MGKLFKFLGFLVGLALLGFFVWLFYRVGAWAGCVLPTAMFR